MRKLAIIAAWVSLALSPLEAATYEIDPNHSTVAFTVRHLVTKVHGTFNKFSGTFTYDKKDPTRSKAEVKIDPGSIDTRVEMRDKDLRSPNYFDTAKCPEMSFQSTKARLEGDKGKLYGDLTMHCVTKPVALDLEVAGEAKDPKGNVHFGASATGKVNRDDWGISSGKGMVGDEVMIDIDIEAKPAKS